jgi:hypothetical protein
MKKLFLVVLAFMWIGIKITLAQDIATTNLTWTVNQLEDLNTKKTSTYNCTFSTRPNNPIRWIQKNNYTTELTVKSSTGTWGNVQTMGKMVYSITLEGETGTLTFERTTSGATILLNLASQAGTGINQLYTVIQVTPN